MSEYEIVLDGTHWRVEAENEVEARAKVLAAAFPKGVRAAISPSAEVKDVTGQPVGAGSEAD